MTIHGVTRACMFTDLILRMITQRAAILHRYQKKNTKIVRQEATKYIPCYIKQRRLLFYILNYLTIISCSTN